MAPCHPINLCLLGPTITALGLAAEAKRAIFGQGSIDDAFWIPWNTCGGYENLNSSWMQLQSIMFFWRRWFNEEALAFIKSFSKDSLVEKVELQLKCSSY